MNHLRRFPRDCFWLTLLAIGGFCLVVGEMELLVVAGVLAGISWFVTEGPRGRTLPRWASNVLVLALLGNMILDAQATPETLPTVLGRFTVWLTLIKLYERRTARDHAQLLGLGLLLMLIGASRTPPPLVFGIILAAYACLGMYCVLLYQLYAAHEHSDRIRRDRDLHGYASSRPTTGRSPGGHLRGLALATGAGVAVLSLVVFLLFPRDVGRGFIEPVVMERGRMDPTIGLDRSMDLETGRRINDDPSLLFTVETIPPPGVPSPGRVGESMLLRAAALERYEDGSWTVERPGLIEFESRPGSAVSVIQPGVTRPDPPPATWQQSFNFVRDTEQLLHLGGPIYVRIDEGARTLEYMQGTRELAVASGGRGRGRVRSVEVRSVPDPAPDVQRALAGDGRDRFRIGGIMVQRGHPTRRMIREVAREILDPLELWPPRRRVRGVDPDWANRAIDAFEDHFRRGGFVYTLDLSDVAAAPGRTGAGDPVVRFLTETRRGHCEYFASAFSLLCQSVDLPARVVIGYSASEWDPEAGVHVVRARHAHAWSEVQIAPWNWRTVDPTPPSVTSATTTDDQTVADRLAGLYDRLEGTWNDRFVGFDPGLQSEILDALQRGREATFDAGLESVRAWAQRVNEFFRLGVAGYIWLGVMAFAFAIAVVAVLRWLRRRMRVARRLGLRGRRALVRDETIRGLAFYVDLLEVMDRRGEVKPEWQTPMAWADTLAVRRPGIGAQVQRLVRLYYDGRFGGRIPDAGAQADAVRTVAEIADRLDRPASEEDAR